MNQLCTMENQKIDYFSQIQGNFSVPGLLFQSYLDVSSCQWFSAMLYLASSCVHCILTIAKVNFSHPLTYFTFLFCFSVYGGLEKMEAGERRKYKTYFKGLIK